ncbi:MAG: hypothetical protein AB9856_06690 [Cellulosilyticaceae bacterium]
MLTLLLKKINEGKIISRAMFNKMDIDELLDLRDEPEFDSEWMRVFNQIEELSYSEADKQINDNIRKESYLKAYEASNSSEIASCVSDDFDLIARAYVLSINDCWLNAVMLIYASNIFPCGEIKPIKTNMDEAFKKIIE